MNDKTREVGKMISRLDKKRRELLREMFDRPVDQWNDLEDGYHFSREVSHFDIPLECRREM